MDQLPFPLEAYLRRIGYQGSLEPTASVLQDLHRAHVHAFAFENLNPFCGLPVPLDAASLYRKFLTDGRGGYCFELNGLFLLLLRHLGFRTRSLLARVAMSPGRFGGRAHQISLVEIGETSWLADVGFGGNGLITALPFVMEEAFDQGLDCFRLMRDETYGYRLEHRLQESWRTLYAFSLDPSQEEDYGMINYFVSTSPDSFFTRALLCVRTTPEARIMLYGTKLKIRSTTKSESMPVETSETLRAVLKQHFQINWPADVTLPAPQEVPPSSREL